MPITTTQDTAVTQNPAPNPKNYLFNLKIKHLTFMLSLLLGGISNTHAQTGHNLFSGNPKAMGLGNAVTADPPGIDAIQFNPAGLTRLKGRQYEIKTIAVGADLTAEFTPTNAYSEANDEVSNQTSTMDGINVYFNGRHYDFPFVVAPMAGISYTPEHSNFTFATASYAPVIAGVKRAEDDPGRFVYHEVGSTRLTYFAPTAAFQVTPTLSMGLSLGFSYFGVGAKSDLRFPNSALGDIEAIRVGICGEFNTQAAVCEGSLDPLTPLASIDLNIQDTFSPTWNFGLLWEPRDWFSWGMVYQSKAEDTLDGTLKITYSEGVQDLFGSLIDTTDPVLLRLLGFEDFEYREQEVGAQVKLEYPQHFATGISVKFLPDWKFNMDLKWTDSGVWEEWVITFDENVDVLGLLGNVLPFVGENNVEGDQLIIPRGYNSAWHVSFGLEHQLNPKLALRAGYEPRPSHAPDDKLDFIIPIADVDLYSLGFSYQWKKDRLIEGAFSYINSSYNISANSSTNFNDESINNFVYNPYAGQSADIELNVYVLMLSYRAQW